MTENNEKPNLIKSAPLALLFVLIIVLFHFFGTNINPKLFGHSTFVWAIRRWTMNDGYFTYCFLVPIISIWLIWQKRSDLLCAEKKPDDYALIFLAGALLLQLASYRTQLPRLSLLAFITLTFSIPWYLHGRQTARIILFPCSYLLLCIPWNFLDRLTFPMRLLAASVSTAIIQGSGITALRRGTGIIIGNNQNFLLDVADPCSGIKYFLALVALAALYSNMTQKTPLKQWSLFLCAVPVALLANIIRILTVAFAAHIFNPQLAEGLYHDASGYIVFVSAVLILIGFGKIINISPKKLLNKWKTELTKDSL